MYKKIYALTLLFCFLAFFSYSAWGFNLSAYSRLMRSWTRQSAMNHFSSCVPYSDWIPGVYGGGFSMEGSLCDTTASFTANYKNYSGYPGLVANGQVNIDISFYGLNTYSGSMTIKIYNGPVVYSYDRTDYTIYFKDFTIYFDIWPGGMQISNVDGGLTIDGQYISANEVLANIVL